jgi:hypothetical protein
MLPPPILAPANEETGTKTSYGDGAGRKEPRIGAVLAAQPDEERSRRT